VKVCLLSNALSIHTQRWINYLKGIGCEVHLVSYRCAEINGAEFHCFPVDRDGSLYKSLHFLKTFKEIRRKIRAINPDFLHAHYLTSYGLLGALVGFKPLIVSAWGSDLLVDSKRSSFHRFIIERVLKKADLVTVMANHMIPRLIELGCKREKILKVTLGIDVKKFNLEGRKGGDGKIIIFSNRVFESEQNIECIVDSLPFVVARQHNLEMRFYGDGSHRRRCEDLVKTFGIEYYVRFFGFVEHSHMPYHLKDADIYVSASVSDGDHVSLMEAMACGLFPVVSDIPANREWIEDGENGFLVPLNNSASLSERIIEAIEKVELREKVRGYNFELVKSKAEFGKDLSLLEEYYRKLSIPKAPVNETTDR
jgi:glycosyltransferase involved in cell wall biosynthesis